MDGMDGMRNDVTTLRTFSVDRIGGFRFSVSFCLLRLFFIIYWLYSIHAGIHFMMYR